MKLFLGKLFATLETLVLLIVPCWLFLIAMANAGIFDSKLIYGVLTLASWKHLLMFVFETFAFDILLFIAFFILIHSICLIHWWVQWLILPLNHTHSFYEIIEFYKLAGSDIFWFIPNKIAGVVISEKAFNNFIKH
jgi:hypothetical protein